MSIRLRFTLLYTLILALTLSVFGVSLYLVQSQDTLNLLRRDLSIGADKLAEGAVYSGGNIPVRPGNPRPIPFNQFSTRREFQDFREREIARILDPNGNLVSSPFGREGDALPLSIEGLKILQDQHEWWQTEIVSDETTLIYNRPVIVDGKVEYIVQIARPLTERNRTLQSLATTLLSAGALTVLIAFGIGWVLSGITLRPIQRLTQTAKEIGDERDFSRRVDYSGPQDEVGLLANTFNGMLSRLQDAFQKVGHALEMQRNFVADVSHELRTPLTTLRGNLGLLRRTPPMPADEQADILNDMVEESDRLIRLVNDLLKLARADAGRNLAKEPVDLSSIMEEVCNQVRQPDSKRDILLNIEGGLQVSGDRDAVKQVLLIALDNAQKYSSGDIHVSMQAKSSLVEIRVQDHGQGIPSGDLEQIFNRFYRSEDSRTPGFGLGLSIAKSLVEGLGGTIKMESAVGKGSTLVLHFPFRS